MTPFLTIVTRCCRRPLLLTNNVFSVLGQNDRDLEQIFVVDKHKRGVYWANRNLAEQVHRIAGEWVYILDDDCRLTSPGFVTLLKDAARQEPDVIMVKSSRPQIAPHTLPKADVWGHADRFRAACCNCLCYAVRADLWREHISAFGRAAGGDWGFLEKLLYHNVKFAWADKVVAQTQQLGRGKLFEDCGKSWFADFVNSFGVELLNASDDWRLQLYRWGTLPRKYRRSFEEPEKHKEPAPRRLQQIKEKNRRALRKAEAKLKIALEKPIKIYPKRAPTEPVEKGHALLSRGGRGG